MTQQKIKMRLIESGYNYKKRGGVEEREVDVEVMLSAQGKPNAGQRNHQHVRK